MRAACVALLLVMGLPVAAQTLKDPPQAPSAPQGAARGTMSIVSGLPAELAGFRRDGDPVDYESRTPGLGASVNYRRVGGTGLVTVYVYDGYSPPRRLTDGARSEEVSAHLRSSGNDIVQSAQQRGTKLSGPVEAAPVPGPGGQPAMRCQRWAMTFDNGDMAESHLCVGVLQGRLLKLRVTQPPAPATRDAEVARFGAEVIAALTGGGAARK